MSGRIMGIVLVLAHLVVARLALEWISWDAALSTVVALFLILYCIFTSASILVDLLEENRDGHAD